jgi:NTE family protein
MATTPDGPIALVLSGGGARGAYEIGALSVLLPALAARGERVSIILGTSAGALNAAWLGAHAHLDVDAVLSRALPIWPAIRFGDVLRPLVTVGGSLRIGRYLAGAPIGRGRLDALLDPSPLAKTVERLIPFDDLARNAEAGRVTVAIATTRSRTGRTVLFVAGQRDLPGEDRVRGIKYINTPRLTGDHVRASAAIPIAFPAVFVDDETAPGWYVDGGTRMNTPIKPAISLGAARLVVIGLNGTDPDETEPDDDRDRRPDAFEGAAHVVQGLLADPLAADVRTLASTNELLRDATRPAPGDKTIKPYIFVAPSRRDAIGELARAVYLDHFAGYGLRGARRDLTLLGHLIGAGRSDMHGELFSYLCFARELAFELLELGSEDANNWLAQEHDDGPWRIGRLPGEPPAPRVSADSRRVETF